MTAGTRRISSFAFRSIFHALHPSFSPPYVARRIYYRLSAALLYPWRSRGLIWTVKAAAVRANLPTCKGLIHIDLQMNPDQRRLDKACSPPRRPPHIQLWSWRWRPARVWDPETWGTAAGNHKLLLFSYWSTQRIHNSSNSSNVQCKKRASSLTERVRLRQTSTKNVSRV